VRTGVLGERVSRVRIDLLGESKCHSGGRVFGVRVIITGGGQAFYVRVNVMADNGCSG
jgi:hypothetical protein